MIYSHIVSRRLLDARGFTRRLIELVPCPNGTLDLDIWYSKDDGWVSIRPRPLLTVLNATAQL